MTEETNTVTEEVVSDIVTKAAVADVEDTGIAPETTTEEESTVEESAEATDELVGNESPKNESDADKDHPVVDVKKSDDTVATAVADIQDSLKNAFGDLTATVKSIADQVAQLTKSLNDVTGNVTTVANQVTEVAKEVADVKGNFNEFGKRVDKVEADTAFRKSGDLGEIVQELAEVPTQKSLWGGRFLKNTDLFN